jgi:hypothetical protein
MFGLDRRARRLGLVRRHRQHRVRRLALELNRHAERFRERCIQTGEILVRIGRLHGQLRLAIFRRPVNREPSRVRPTLAHRRQHLRRQLSEPRLQGFVLDE